MKPRVISYLRHDLSARQALAMALDCWAESRHLPVLLVTPAGEAMETVKTIRVALAKEKKKQGEKVHYGFTLSEPFPYTDDSVKGEAVVMNWRLTALQNVKNLRLHQKESTDGRTDQQLTAQDS